MLPDEDVLILPAAWRRHLHPRRGGAPGPAIRRTGGKTAPELMVKAKAKSAFAKLRADDPRTAAVHRHLAGTPDPVGAATVAALVQYVLDRYELPDDPNRVFADHWAAEHGVVFAACAAVEVTRTPRHFDGPESGKRSVSFYSADRDRAHRGALRRVRALLAAAGDEEYAEAERALERYRVSPGLRWPVSYLLPTRADWLAECLAEPGWADDGDRVLRLCALTDAAQLGDPAPGASQSDTTREVLVTLADACGADLLPYLLHRLDGGARSLTAAERTAVCETIAVLPSDAAFRALLDRSRSGRDRTAVQALGQAMERFPVRALRLLAGAGTRHARELLAGHVRAHPAAVAAALPGLPAGERAEVEAVAAPAVPDADAAPAATPGFLRDLPGDRPVKPVVPGLEPPAVRAMAWRDGERAEWLASDSGTFQRPKESFEELAEKRRRGELSKVVSLFLYGPEELVRPLLPGWTLDDELSYLEEDMTVIIARYELDALAPALAFAGRGALGREVLLPYTGEEVALWMGDRLARPGGARQTEAWFDRHGLTAVPYLVPAALGKAAKPRRAAETALRHLAARHGVDAVAAAAADAFPEAADPLREVLSAHPVRTGLARRPKPPDWADVAGLPPVLLRDGATALSADATRALVELLALPDPYEVGAMRDDCDPASLAAFGLALFDRWQAAGAPAKESWALLQLGRTGDGGTVRRLVPLIERWPGERGSAKAEKGVDVLAALGSDMALSALDRIARTTKSEALRYAAESRLEEAAAARGLDLDHLMDRLVPDFGLDADASMTLDYGTRRFRVGFDEEFRPFVTDEDGEVRASLPKPAAADPADPAVAAYREFAALKKDVRAVVAERRRRLLKAMRYERSWTHEEFRDHFVRHPLVGLIARRLVWLALDGAPDAGAPDAGAATAFRVAEDGTFADVHDDPFVPSGTARIQVAHPARLDEKDVGAWAGVLADYELVQPFEQLGHPVVRLAGDEPDGDRLVRFDGTRLPVDDLWSILHRDSWTQEAGGDAYEVRLVRRLGGARRVVVDLASARTVPDRFHLVVRGVRAATDGGAPLPFGALSPVEISETLSVLLPARP
ncbi:DUF4132 domain-containing protein [Actinomadura sp. WAC 06369]|uniref:DUF4132 domain-containing protein n=1 Tax=Actinomadura sp. WAC 06369 TaxID=2203193 RepID=UPI000F7AB911|nr:DUF4132 domain-containing protein [Actinomadura sp. WAC 06369]RSN53924.1 molybdate metabolism regulator [Actinomadura sp. WAC 06369]